MECKYCGSTTWGAKNDTYCTDCESKWYREEYPQVQADMIMSDCNYNLDLIRMVSDESTNKIKGVHGV